MDAYLFLQRFAPFSLLGETEMRKVASELSSVFYPRNTSIFTQGISTIESLHIVEDGEAERYFEGDDLSTEQSLMRSGDIFGGISVLVNDGVSIRSLRTTEDTSFYLWPRESFVEVCRTNIRFLEFFTDSFGRRMLDRSYAALAAKTIQANEEALQFLNQPVSSIAQKNLISCPASTTIHTAAQLMSQNSCSSILITSPENSFVGIVTDSDLRQKVVAKRLDIDTSVEKIMSSPLRTLSSQALVFEVLLTMMHDNIKYLGITGPEEEVTGIVTNKDILSAQGQSPLFLISEVGRATTTDALQRQYQRLPGIIRMVMAGGARTQNLNRLITTISDAILEKIITFALKKHGPPPCLFSFIVLGSEGRKEQTLKTDQDNAIVYEDTDEQSAEEVHTYFHALGETICASLNTVGYAFCPGDIMAQNHKWCQPLTVWKEYFRSWIRFASPEDLLNSTIFFDLRCAYGHEPLVTELRTYLMERLAEWPLFLGYLAENAQHFKPPMGFFRNFIVESKGEHRDSFDIKKVMVPIIDFARIHTLKHGLSETNTQARLLQLHRRKLLSAETFHEMDQAYSYLMHMRFTRQIHAIMVEKSGPDNHINPKKLTRIEQTMLKEIFSRIDSMQKEIIYRVNDPVSF